MDGRAACLVGWVEFRLNSVFWFDIFSKNVRKQTLNEMNMSRDDEEDSCVLDHKRDQDANNANKKDDVIKQIRKVMDEVSHHALKGRWCNWYDTRRRSLDAHAKQIHKWGAAQAYEEDEKGCGDGTMTCDLCSHMTGRRRCYLQRGEGAGQGTGWPHTPPLLLESSSQTLKLHLLLAHGRQERRGILTLLHTHWERRQSITTHCCIHSVCVWYKLTRS